MVATMGRAVYEQAEAAGYIEALQQFGVQFVTDTCWYAVAMPHVCGRIPCRCSLDRRPLTCVGMRQVHADRASGAGRLDYASYQLCKICPLRSRVGQPQSAFQHSGSLRGGREHRRGCPASLVVSADHWLRQAATTLQHQYGRAAALARYCRLPVKH